MVSDLPLSALVSQTMVASAMEGRARGSYADAVMRILNRVSGD